MMDERTTGIVNELKKKVSIKYPLFEMSVFGSTARGHQSKESDIDVFIRLPVVNREQEEDLFDIAYDLELKYDCLIDIIVLSDENLSDAHAKPMILNDIMEEGIAV
ncbi:MAG: nucleotidyltransferase domain-containing protein [Pseudomonadota bacterium]